MKETVVDEEFIARMHKYRVPADKSSSLFEASRDNIVVFVERMIGISLYAWEIDFLMRFQHMLEGKTGKNKLAALTSRQIGKSFSLAAAALWACTFNKYPGTAHNNTVVGIVSASDRQAKELMREITKLIYAGDRHMFEEYEAKDFFSSLLDASGQNNTEIMTFKDSYKSPNDLFLAGSKSGSQIMSYPPTAKVLGKSFTLIFVDEVGRSESINDEFLLDELLPTGSATQAKEVYTSTPWQPGGYFYELVSDAGRFRDYADVVTYTIDALKHEEKGSEQYLYVQENMIRPLREAGEFNSVRRAFYCEFVKSERNFFDPEKVRGLFERPLSMLDSYDGPCDIGVDLGGKVSSKTVVTVSCLNDDGDVYRLYKKVYPVGEDDSLMYDLEFDIMKRFPNWQRIIPDDAPVAMYLIREMEDKGWEVHPMEFRKDKMKKFGAFRALLNKGKVFSFDDPDLKSEMFELESNTGSRQSVITAPRGGSDDLIDSFVMSCYFFLDDLGVKVGVYDWDEL